MKKIARLIHFIKDFLGNAKNGKVLALLNLVFCIAAVIGNYYMQVFCKPTPWAFITLLITFIPVIFFPVVKDKLTRILPVFFFLFGIAFCICIYCILFLSTEILLAFFFIFIGIGILAFVPYVLALQIFLTVFRNNSFAHFKKYFVAGIAVSLFFVTICVIQYSRTNNQLKALTHNSLDDISIEPTYMAEKIIGMHFKYHTQICLYDGWRPPLHEPILIIGYRFSGKDDPFGALNLSERIKLYRHIFPKNPVKMKCACAKPGSLEYFSDSVFNE